MYKRQLDKNAIGIHCYTYTYTCKKFLASNLIVYYTGLSKYPPVHTLERLSTLLDTHIITLEESRVQTTLEETRTNNS